MRKHDGPSGISSDINARAWSDVLFAEKPEPLVTYRTGWVVYEESLTKGNFVGRGWNGAGYVNTESRDGTGQMYT